MDNQKHISKEQTKEQTKEHLKEIFTSMASGHLDDLMTQNLMFFGFDSEEHIERVRDKSIEYIRKIFEELERVGLIFAMCAIDETNKLMGYITIAKMSDGTVEIINLFVKKEYRNQGLGTKLYKNLTSNKNVKKITLLSGLNSINFWEKKGFKVINSSLDHIVMCNFKPKTGIIVFKLDDGDVDEVKKIIENTR